MAERVPIFPHVGRFRGGPLDGQEAPVPLIGGGMPLIVAYRPDSDPPQLVLPIQVPQGDEWPRYINLGNSGLKPGQPYPFTFFDPDRPHKRDHGHA